MHAINSELTLRAYICVCIRIMVHDRVTKGRLKLRTDMVLCKGLRYDSPNFRQHLNKHAHCFSPIFPMLAGCLLFAACRTYFPP